MINYDNLINSGCIQSVDAQGRICLPRSVRADATIGAGINYEVWYDPETNDLLLRRCTYEPPIVEKVRALKMMLGDWLESRPMEQEKINEYMEYILAKVKGL